MERTVIPFRLRERDGRVVVEQSVNEDPERWGYSLLEEALGFAPRVATGFPVVRATVEYSGEGYASVMAWVQVVRYRIDGSDEEVLVDKPPQLADDGSPYCYWGPNPTFFDAPATAHSDMRWTAHAFLTASPDAVMSKTLQPVCGFSWGYAVTSGQPEIFEVAKLDHAAWPGARTILQAHYPSWRFRS